MVIFLRVPKFDHAVSKEKTNRSSPFYRSEMVGRIRVDISTEYVVTLAMSQNPDAVCLSGLISSEDAQ